MEEKTAQDVLIAECLFDFIWVNDGKFCALIHPESEMLKNYQKGRTGEYFSDAFRRVPPFSSNSDYLHSMIYQLGIKGLNITIHTDNSLMSLLYNSLVYNPGVLSFEKKQYESASTLSEAVTTAILAFYGKKEEVDLLEKSLILKI